MNVIKISERRVWHFLMPISVLCLFAASGFIAMMRGEQDDLRQFENRAETAFPNWLFKHWVEGKYQVQFTAALSDRLPGAIKSKMYHFRWRNPLLLALQKRLFSFSEYYVNFKDNVYLYGEPENLYLMYDLYSLKDDSDNTISEWAEGIHNAMDENPTIPFYLYYVSRDDDVRLDNDCRGTNFQTITSNFPIPSSHTACLQITNFEQYRRFFYQTDHHWQCFGSYQGYKDVFDLLDLENQGETLMCPVVPSDNFTGLPDDNSPIEFDEVRPVLVSRKHHEAKSRDTGTAELFAGKMYMYCFDCFPMNIYKEGESFKYGNEELVLSNHDSIFEYNITYSTIYGRDYGEIVFETTRSDRPNILLIGDSYDNAILKLLAGHYHFLYSVDLRHYSNQKGELFNISKYICEHDINQVLIIGCWIMYNGNLYEPLSACVI